ncbi:UDP-2,3-diacylglucosamine diphosphatase [Catenovulum sediminis]|uniref:UDP-2,3-diacylglucosamine diphosphatase n=1 Tax=Catenovulum sediminis TaxID=1740262 RepID=UPI00117F94A7|nr:UDP-2,3-diacylglucosamine diphosphatase [Catenovulum sediminis]
MSVYFISDLHLSQERPDMTGAFLRFCRNLPADSKALYILGDFLEYWVGDDEDAAWLEPIKHALLRISQDICPVFFMHGNRDFLIGKKFARETGMQLLPEPSLIDLYGQRVLILHGDSLCTQDVSYQKYRKVVRNKIIQFLFLLLPLKTRHKIFGAGREKSKQKQKCISNMQILDVTPQAVSELMDNYQTDLLIHGHTHRPAIHQNARNACRGTRIVLGDWYTQGSILEVSEDGYMLTSMPL